MSLPNYRAILSYDAEQNVFRARSPELEHCFGEGKTRSEAILNLEQEMEAQLHHLQEQKQQVPKALDDHGYTGEITTHVSKHLHKELLWQARVEGVELPQLVSEILSAGLELRRQSTRSTRNPNQNRSEGNRPAHSNREHQGGRNYGNNYHPELMDDRANFIQYVRGIDSTNNRGPSNRKDKPHHQQRRKNNRPHHQNRRPAGSGEAENKQNAAMESAPVQAITPPEPVQAAPEMNSSENTNT